MGLKSLLGGSRAGAGGRRQERSRTAADREYLVAWATSHDGVEAFVEPENSFNDLTIVLVDKEGHWTRRAPGGAKGAARVGRDAAIPVYDVVKVGYPQRMRDRIERARVRRRREQRAALVRERTADPAPSGE